MRTFATQGVVTVRKEVPRKKYNKREFSDKVSQGQKVN